jgi:hypothetical protein
MRPTIVHFDPRVTVWATVSRLRQHGDLFS